MDRIEGLDRLIASKEYRKGTGLPEKITEEYVLLAQGEYNINYAFIHPLTGQELVLRVNCGSQMHLRDQIGYEYRALEMLKESGRTPDVYYHDGSGRYLDHGILVMERLPGHAMDYDTEIDLAADILADIHSVRIKKTMLPGEGDDSGMRTLISPDDPLQAILDECEQMVRKYMDSEAGDDRTKGKIRHLLDLGHKRLGEGSSEAPYKCCINTELNSTNFLINGRGSQNYLIDWEKPLYGDPAQDLGHFLAPTTTFWKTDTILGPSEIDGFIDLYTDRVAGRFDVTGLKDRVHDYVPATCLRGITWCAMAWVEYREPGRMLTNESTAIKLDQYLEHSFLDRIEELLRK